MKNMTLQVRNLSKALCALLLLVGTPFATTVHAWTVTWLGFEDTELKTVENVQTGDNVNDQTPTPPKVDCYQFISWNGSADYVTSDLVIRAVYEQYKYILSIDPEPEMLNGTIVAEEPFAFDINNQIANIPCGTTVTVRAVPQQGYKLSKWYQNGVELNTTATTIEITLDESTVLEGNIAIRATFEQDTETAIDNTDSQKSKVGSRKMIDNGQLFLIRDGKAYSITGAEVR